MPARVPQPDRRAPGSERAPALFISHGSPLAVMDEPFKTALRRFGVQLRDPKGLVIVSAHWQAMRPLRATGSRRPQVLHDFEGFPSWLDSLTWKVQGSPELAQLVVDTLKTAGITALLDASHGIDSGAWIPLSMMFPGGRSPVVQLSLPSASTPRDILQIGRALAILRHKGCMLVGTGGIVHNPSRIRFDYQPPTEPWAIAFDNWVRDRLDEMDEDALLDYRVRAPQAHLAAPTSEHLDPLFIVLGARLEGDRVLHLYEGFHGGNLSLRSFALLGRRADDVRLPDAMAVA
jgi:4,5-DOPA dioxygenase extradiol